MVKRWKEKLMLGIISTSALLVAAILFSLILHIFVRGLPVVSWEFLTENPLKMGKEGGIFSTIVSTVYLVGLAIGLSGPLGVGAALYLTEYRSRKSKVVRVVEMCTEALSGIPSIVFGLFGFVFFVIFLHMGWSVLSGGLTLALMCLPTIVRASQEAVRGVPSEYRENSLALGASRWQTIRYVVLPAAFPGILTGIILAIGRGVGETAAVLLTAGTALGTPLLLSDPARSMAVHLYFLASEGISMERAYGTATILLILVMGINYLARYYLQKVAKPGS